MTVIATFSTSPGVAGQRRTLLAIGSGLTGLIATKALKFSQVNITDALVFVTRIAVQWTSYFASQATPWTPFVPAVVKATVLIALAVVAVANIAELIAAQPSSRRTIPERRGSRFLLCHNALQRSRSITKGWF